MKESDLVLDSPQKILNIQKKIDEIKENNFWLVVGKNSRIIKDWRELVIKYPENTIRYYQHLRLHPLERSSGRIFPLRGKKFKGAWE